jgi:NAD+ diphosphatase
MSPRFVPAVVPAAPLERAAWLAFRDHDLLVEVTPEGLAFPTHASLDALQIKPIRTQFLGTLDGAPCLSAELDDATEAPPGHRFLSLRALYGKLDAVRFDLAGLAFQIQRWDRDHQRCGRCGGPTVGRAHERSRRCETCKLDFYPRVAPCVITLITDGDRALLTRSSRLPEGMFALVAGFVEAGETLEQCVAREVLEEVGVRIGKPRYFGSQPWPFPHQLMVGFFADYEGGDIVVDKTELEDARWFSRDAMPMLPPKISIARALIDAWLAEKAR